MSRKKTTPISDEMIVLYELEELPDGTLRIGNSIEAPMQEAVLLVQQKKAKHESAPIGELPKCWGGVEEVAVDGNDNDQ